MKSDAKVEKALGSSSTHGAGKKKKSEVIENKELAQLAEVDDWEKLIDLDKLEKDTEKAEQAEQDAGAKVHASEKNQGKSGKGGKKAGQKLEEAKKQEELCEKDNKPEGEDFPDEPEYSKENEVFYVKSRFRCPIICILGHVDTGKTKILDKIRKTNVQNGEAGGITQQIGASFVPQYKLKEEVAKLEKPYKKIDVEIPGLLIIDTPGHESFANLRKRGESLCDFAILVVDIKHGLENQTIESLKMLTEKKTPFIVALNKLDVLDAWKSNPDDSSLGSLEAQSKYTQAQYYERFEKVRQHFQEHDIPIMNYWQNEDLEGTQSVVPTSAYTGEGLPDLLGYITEFTQTQMAMHITPKLDFNCTVMEVKKLEGLGTTTDVILVDGTLKEGDKIVISGFEGPIKTTVRALLTPKPLKELRVKAE